MKLARSFVSGIGGIVLGEREPFLSQVSGVIHVGANTGQERWKYFSMGLRVLWVEPIPKVFAQLQANLSMVPWQRAVRALVTDRDDEPCQFHVANNNGASSSLLELKEHKNVWPSITYTETISLRSTTLPTLLRDHGIDLAAYDALILDTQGSELRVLRGAEPILGTFSFIKTEVADFEAYAGCCQLADIDSYLREQGFREMYRQPFARSANGGTYYDVTYRRVA